MVLPNPENIPPVLGWVCAGKGVCCWGGMGLVAVLVLREGEGDDDLPLDEPPLDPPLAIIMLILCLWMGVG